MIDLHKITGRIPEMMVSISRISGIIELCGGLSNMFQRKSGRSRERKELAMKAKRILAIALFVTMLAALAPMAMADDAVKVSSVSASNYNRNTAYTYDPSKESDTYFVITGPYDSIGQSGPPQIGWGVQYQVTFYLSGTLNLANDTVYVNGSKMDNYTSNYGRVSITEGTITCMFTAQRGGNRQTYDITIRDDSMETTRTHSTTIVYYDTNSSSGTSGWYSSGGTMSVTARRSGSNYSVSTSGQMIYIDYDSAYHSAGTYIDVDFAFNDLYGNRIPNYSNASLKGVTSNGSTPFIYPYQYDQQWLMRGQFTNVLSIPVTIDVTNTRVSFVVDANGQRYTSPDYTIYWRDTRQNTGSGSLTINPSRAPSISVGQDYTFTITSNNILNTGAYFTLEVGGQSGIVTTATGKYLTIRGVSPGYTWLNVRDTWGKLIDTIQVQVVSSGSSTSTTTTTTGGALYSVTANSLNLRAGAGTGFAVLGQARSGNQLEVLEILNNGWARVRWGASQAYASMSYLRYVSGTVGGTTTTTYTPSSSNLAGTSTGYLGGNYLDGSTLGGSYLGGDWNNYSVSSGVYMTLNVDYSTVYSGPGTTYTSIGTATRGQRVYVSRITNNGWAEVAWSSGAGSVAYINVAHLY